MTVDFSPLQYLSYEYPTLSKAVLEGDKGKQKKCSCLVLLPTQVDLDCLPVIS